MIAEVPRPSPTSNTIQTASGPPTYGSRPSCVNAWTESLPWSYEDVLAQHVWRTVQEELPALRAVIKTELKLRSAITACAHRLHKCRSQGEFPSEFISLDLASNNRAVFRA
jgi:hypothetical protein